MHLKEDATAITNRRRFTRHSPKDGVRLRVRCSGDSNKGGQCAVSVVDLSQVGACVNLDEALDAGAETEVELIPPQGGVGIRRRSSVAWSSPNPDGTFTVGLQWEYLLEFTDLRKLANTSESMTSVFDDEDCLISTIFLGKKKKLVALSQTQACLVHIYPKGPDIGKRHVLSSTPSILGRLNSCDISIPDGSVSRRHACIQSNGNGYEALDLDSTNGTYVNDASINRHPLRDGDYVQIGSHIFRYLCGGNIESEYHEEIYRLTIYDALTNVANKRHLLEFLDREINRSRRHTHPLCVILLDIDHFKHINDQIGHLGGDFALRELASRVNQTVRKEELFARFGGEEFVIVLPETPLEKALVVAERIRRLVERHEFRFEDHPFRLTISAGVATIQDNDAKNAADLLRRADEKLYIAKSKGRNCVEG